MAVVILITNIGRIEASYGGGEYVEIIYGENTVPTDVINVFDYEAGRPRIANTPKAVEKVLLAWVREDSPELEVYETRLLA